MTINVRITPPPQVNVEVGVPTAGDVEGATPPAHTAL